MRCCRSRSADAVAVVLALALATPARAGSCCAGPTTSVPSRLRRDERLGAGTSLTGTGTVARWGTASEVTSASPGEGRLTIDVFAGWRWDAKGQLALTVPAMLQHVGAGGVGEWGVGAGDTRLSVLWEPFAEVRRAGGRPGAPVPLLVAGLRLPTGRSWDDARLPLKADATGDGDVAVTATAQVERTIDAIPWSVSVSTEVGTGPQGPRPTLDVAAGVGRSFDEHWSLYASASHHERFVGAARTARTSVGFRVQHAWPGVGRLWAGVTGDLPIPFLGTDLPVELRGTIGFAWAH
jgi:hypothetical protein